MKEGNVGDGGDGEDEADLLDDAGAASPGIGAS